MTFKKTALFAAMIFAAGTVAADTIEEINKLEINASVDQSERNIDTGSSFFDSSKLVLNMDSGAPANIVLNEQTNTGDVSANLSGSGDYNYIDASVDGAMDGFNSASISATAVGSTLSVNIAGREVFESIYSDGGDKQLEIYNGQDGSLGMASLQANTGDISSSVSTEAGDVASNVLGASGSFNTASVAATAVGNTVSVNVGGVVK